MTSLWYLHKVAVLAFTPREGQTLFQVLQLQCPYIIQLTPMSSPYVLVVLKAQVGWLGLPSERKNNNAGDYNTAVSLKNLGPDSSPSIDILEWPQKCHLMQAYNENKISFSVPFLCLVCCDCFCTVEKRYTPGVANYRDWEWASLEQDDTKALLKGQGKKKIKISENRQMPSSVHSSAIK